MPTAPEEMTLKVIAHIHTAFPTKFGIPRQSGLVDELRGEVIFTPEYRNADADNDHACNHTQDAAQADFLTENIHMQNFLFCIARLEASPQGEPYEVIYNKYPVKCTPLSRVNLFKISHLTL